MKRIIVPMTDPFPAYGEAARHVQALRKKGVHCHIRPNPGTPGPCLEIIFDSDSPDMRSRTGRQQSPTRPSNTETTRRHARRIASQPS